MVCKPQALSAAENTDERAPSECSDWLRRPGTRGSPGRRGAASGGAPSCARNLKVLLARGHAKETLRLFGTGAPAAVKLLALGLAGGAAESLKWTLPVLLGDVEEALGPGSAGDASEDAKALVLRDIFGDEAVRTMMSPEESTKGTLGRMDTVAGWPSSPASPS